MGRVWIYLLCFLLLLIAGYAVPVWWGGYSGFRVYRAAEFISEDFPRGVIAAQARNGRNLSKVKDKEGKPQKLKDVLVERGLIPITIYLEEWQTAFNPDTEETTLFYPLSKDIPDQNKVRLELLTRLKALCKTHDFMRDASWDGKYIVVRYQTLRAST